MKILRKKPEKIKVHHYEYQIRASVRHRRMSKVFLFNAQKQHCFSHDQMWGLTNDDLRLR